MGKVKAHYTSLQANLSKNNTNSSSPQRYASPIRTVME